jgi:hypothetical protein
MATVYIHNVDELQLIGNDPGYPADGTYEVSNSFDCGDTATWNGGSGFAPLPEFSGSFDGSNFEISNLYINRPSDSNIGVFAKASGALLKNINLTDMTVAGGSYTGGIVGLHDAVNTITFNHCHVDGSFVSSGIIGGIIANARWVNIQNCSTDLTCVGGTIGGISANLLSDSTISDCTVALYSPHCHGLGGIARNIGVGLINRCHVTVNATGTSWNQAGGIIGYGNGTSLINSDVTGRLEFTGGSVGGAAGYLSGTTPISDCTSTVDMFLTVTSGTLGGFVATTFSQLINSCHSYGNINCAVDCYNSGMFAGQISYDVSNCSAHGNFTIVGTSANVGGFVGYSTGGNAVNCYALGDVSAGSSDIIGGFAGYIANPAYNCWAKGNVVAGQGQGSTYYFGGFAGESFSDLYRCYALGDVTGAGNVGGFVGMDWGGDTSQCFALGNVSNSAVDNVSTCYTGGFAGLITALGIYDCYSKGNVTSNTSGGDQTGVGGFCGRLGGNQDTTMSRCYSKGLVTAPVGSVVGGLIGYKEGLVGLPVSRSYWDTETSGQITSAGGTGKTTAEMKLLSTYAGWSFPPWRG